MELSEITREQLAAFAENEGATPAQRSQLFALWTGQTNVSPELRTLLADITWPNERDRLLKILNGTAVPSSDLVALVERMKWQ